MKTPHLKCSSYAGDLRKKFKAIIILMLVAALILTFSGCDLNGEVEGEGTPENPYLLSSLEDMEEIGTRIEDLPMDAHYKLVEDIDASVTDDESYGENEGKGWDPIGLRDFEFEGTFDGNGHTISNLTIDRPEEDYAGLFGVLGEEAEVKNLRLEDVEIRGNDWVGALAGSSDAHISSVEAAGEIEGKFMVGGLAGGSQSGEVLSSSFEGRVEARILVGGLLGNNNSLVEESHVEAEVKGRREWIGGFLGRTAPESEIIDSSAFVEVDGDRRTGGFVGLNAGDIRSSQAEGVVRGEGDVGIDLTEEYEEGIGGFIGRNEFGEVKDSTARVDVSGNGDVGGFIGGNEDSVVRNCYAFGDVEGDWRSGGLMGYNWGTVKNCHASGDVSGLQNAGGLVGLNEELIEESSARGNVKTRENRAGGLVGWNDGGRIFDSYARGNVTAAGQAGGFIGYNDGVIENTYSSGDVAGERRGGLIGVAGEGEVTAGFYDRDAIDFKEEETGFEEKEAKKGIPLSSDEFADQEIFEEIGWNFEEIWFIGEEGYPLLQNEK